MDVEIELDGVPYIAKVLDYNEGYDAKTNCEADDGYDGEAPSVEYVLRDAATGVEVERTEEATDAILEALGIGG